MTGDLFSDLPPGDGAARPASAPGDAPPASRQVASLPARDAVPLTREGDSPAAPERSDARPDGGSGPPRFDALTAPVAPGVTLVEASAGTGKTYALTELVLRLLLDPDVRDLDGPDGLPDLRRLLVVTFTVAATEELKTRIRRALRVALDAFEADPEAEPPGLVAGFVERFGNSPGDRARSVRRLRRALGQSGEAGVFTIHGFCKRVLERSAFESGEPFAFDFTEDADRLKQRAARDVWHALAAEHPALGPLAVAAGWSLDRLLEHEGHATRYDRTAVVPAAPPLADALAAAEAARAALGRVWDPAAQLEVVEPNLWRTAKKYIDFTGDLPGAFKKVRAFADGDLARLGDVEACATDAVCEAVKDGSKAGKAAVARVRDDAGFRACDGVAEAVEAVRLSLVHAFVERLGAAFGRLKEQAAVLTFDDLVDRLDRALAPDAPTRAALVRSIQAQFSVALIDEFQDTDPKQYRIFRTAFGDPGPGTEDGGPTSSAADGDRSPVPGPPPAAARPLFFIGDPKQAIYAFRGADVFAYLEAKKDARRAYTLGINYRSAPRLVEAVNRTFGRLGDGGRPFVYDGIPFRSVAPRPDAEAGIRGVEGSPLVWWGLDHLKTNWTGAVSKEPAREAAQDAVVAEITRLLNDPTVEVRDGDRWRRIEARDVAVLVRKNQQARDLQDALRRLGVPSVVGKGDDIRQAREMDELERVLRAVASPGDRRAVRAALATEMWGWTAADFLDDEMDARVDAVADALRRDRAVWREHGVFRMLAGLFRRGKMLDRLQGYLDRERRLTNLRHAVELLHDAEAAEGRSPDELLHWVRTRESHTFSQASAVEMRLESDADAVQLVTMHNAKGLEYPVVFAPFVWDEGDKETWFGTFVERPPVAHVDGGASAVYDLGSENQEHHRALADAERLAESLRLTYVAMTRARERLYVVWGPLSGGHMSGLGHLLRDVEIPLLEDGLAALDAATKKRASGALGDTVEALRDWVEAEGLDDLMAVAPLPRGSAPVETRAEASATGAARPVDRELAARVERAAITGSFSAWASGIAADVRHDDAGDAAPADDTPEAGIFAFAAGPRAGTCLHEVLQFADVSKPDLYLDSESEASGRVARTLRLHGLHAARPHRAPLDPARAVCEMVAAVASAEVPDFGFALTDVAPDRDVRDTEWQFHAPRRPSSPAAIADVFEEHGDAELRAYAPALRTLSAGVAEDLFTGIADLVVQHPSPSGDDPGGPFYLFDWKSNHLGPTPGHYGPDAIARSMRSHHYLLQAHLYAVGLHRHLRARLGDTYDPAEHLGGVAYVFLRGVAEGAETGWWSARPTPALLDALDRLLFSDA